MLLYIECARPSWWLFCWKLCVLQVHDHLLFFVRLFSFSSNFSNFFFSFTHSPRASLDVDLVSSLPLSITWHVSFMLLAALLFLVLELLLCCWGFDIFKSCTLHSHFYGQFSLYVFFSLTFFLLGTNNFVDTVDGTAYTNNDDGEYSFFDCRWLLLLLMSHFIYVNISCFAVTINRMQTFDFFHTIFFSQLSKPDQQAFTAPFLLF